MFTKLKYKFSYSIQFNILTTAFIFNSILMFAQGTSFEKIYSTNGVSYGRDVIEKQDNGFLIVGSITPLSTSVLVMDIDQNGNLISEKHLLPGLIRSVTNSYDNNYILTGIANNEDILLIKITPEGDTLRSKTIIKTKTVYGTKIINTSDTGYAITGWIQNPNHDIYLVKMNKDCDTLWTKSYGDYRTDLGYDICELPDKGFIIAGITSWFISEYEIYRSACVIRTDSTGALLWSKRFNVNGYADCGGVVASIDGNIVIAGSTYNTDPFSPELYLLKLNMNGDSLSIKTYGEIMRGGITAIQPTFDGQYIMTGIGGLLKMDKNCNIIWFKPLNGVGLSVKQTSDEGFIVSGVTTDGNYDIIFVKTTKDGIVSVEDEILTPLDYNVLQNYPNPFNPSTIIKYEIPGQSASGGRNDNALVTLKVYDVLGNEIITLVNEEKPAGNYEVEFDGSELSSGIYFYRLLVGEYVEAKKMVLIK